MFCVSPQGVCLVVSLTSKATLLQTLAKKPNTLLFSLGQLTMPDRKKIVQKGLDSFGKKLSDSAFNNQVCIKILFHFLSYYYFLKTVGVFGSSRL